MKWLRMGILASALALAGCANIQNAYNTLTGTSIDSRSVYIAAQGFNALEASATNYLSLKKCGPNVTVICRDPVISSKLIPAVRSGRKIRDELEDFLLQHPGQLGSKGLYDALVSISNTIRDLIPQKGQ